ncbi:uncharacterized protein [Macrobrachium rosenbergii]|uniref:uncharacterized protein n=1 Tax=Macrobrachium rosenbergii TaxID=79674 RepID=UPI0034D527FF
MKDAKGWNMPNSSVLQWTSSWSEPNPYQCSYAVNDVYAGTDFVQAEESDGQALNYAADQYGGYKAEVTYYGEPPCPREMEPRHFQTPELRATTKTQHANLHPATRSPEPSYH